jgi:hypothetical protein
MDAPSAAQKQVMVLHSPYYIVLEKLENLNGGIGSV